MFKQKRVTIVNHEKWPKHRSMPILIRKHERELGSHVPGTVHVETKPVWGHQCQVQTTTRNYNLVKPQAA